MSRRICRVRSTGATATSSASDRALRWHRGDACGRRSRSCRGLRDLPGVDARRAAGDRCGAPLRRRDRSAARLRVGNARAVRRRRRPAPRARRRDHGARSAGHRGSLGTVVHLRALRTGGTRLPLAPRVDRRRRARDHIGDRCRRLGVDGVTGARHDHHLGTAHLLGHPRRDLTVLRVSFADDEVTGISRLPNRDHSDGARPYPTRGAPPPSRPGRCGGGRHRPRP